MTAPSTYPVHVDARMDPHLSRWLWLVKWVLVIPHYITLVFLWIAFVVLSVVAFFAILFTGRYPKPIFDFNLGVMRRTWRVNTVLLSSDILAQSGSRGSRPAPQRAPSARPSRAQPAGRGGRTGPHLHAGEA